MKYHDTDLPEHYLALEPAREDGPEATLRFVVVWPRKVHRYIDLSISSARALYHNLKRMLLELDPDAGVELQPIAIDGGKPSTAQRLCAMQDQLLDQLGYEIEGEQREQARETIALLAELRELLSE